jgi:hypothetical protein
MTRFFVFFILIFTLSSCTSDGWSIDEISGTYFVKPEEKSLFDKWFKRDNVTGWNYNNEFDIKLVLYPDSTYARIPLSSGFELEDAGGDSGTWYIKSDSVCLIHWFQPGITSGRPNAKTWYRDVLIIPEQGELFVWDFPYISRGKVLERR